MPSSIDPIVPVIYKKLQQQPLTVEEQALLNNWLQQQPGEGVFDNEHNDEALRSYLAMRFDEAGLQKALQQFRNKLAATHSHHSTTSSASEAAPGTQALAAAGKRIRRLQWSLAAAVILLCITAIALMWIAKQHKQSNVTPGNEQPVLAHDALPGSDKAILTLANGKKIELGNTPAAIVQEGSLRVLNKGGQLRYQGAPNAITYHTLTTPRGGQFKLLLPDGTAVWLNAASSITYPTRFAAGERRVSISGEAYFEVAKDAQKPFHVTTSPAPGRSEGDDIEVLGTHFNINSYSDERYVKTTLLEGSVRYTSRNKNRLTGNTEQVVLKPGEQVIAGSHSPLTIDHSPDLEEVMAWKNGSFHFNRAGLEAVMRQLSRWYDVDIVYEKQIPDIHFEGDMQRNLNLSQVLTGLGKMGVHFKIEGKKLIVTQ
jgi:ferric-dicitrate binding protein FerR (iron transport regulator)